MDMHEAMEWLKETGGVVRFSATEMRLAVEDPQDEDERVVVIRPMTDPAETFVRVVEDVQTLWTAKTRRTGLKVVS